MSSEIKTKQENYYVYLLIDPRNNEVFYVGKGHNSRVLAHENEAKKRKDKNEVEKIKRINDIINSGYEVKKYIYSTHNTEDEAFDKEDELITFYRKIYPGQLTNIQGGHKSKHTMTSEEMNDILTEFENAEFGNERILFVKRTVNNSWDYMMTPDEHHEYFRGDWAISGEKTKKIELVCGVYNNIIKYVCKPTSWEFVGIRESGRKEYRFDGEVYKKHKYLNKSIEGFKKMVYDKKTKSYKEIGIFGNASATGYINL